MLMGLMLHPFADKSRLDHALWLWLCRRKLPHSALVHTYAGSRLPIMGLPELGDWSLPLPDIRCG